MTALKDLSYFGLLAPELHEEIFSYCKQSDLLNLSCCNKTWKRTLKGRLWKNVSISYSSLQRKNFSFYASKKKFRKLKYSRSISFVDDTNPPHGTAEEAKCPENFYKLLHYISTENLDELNLEGIFVDADSVRTCCQTFHRVRKLNIRGHSSSHVVSPDVFSIISQLYCLRELNFGGVLIRLDILNVTNSNMSTAGFIDFPSMSNLTELVLTDCNIKHVDLSQITHLTSLRKIDLSSSCSVHDEEVGYFTGLPMLRELRLSCCGVTNEGLKHIGNIATLQHLNIQSTQVTDDGMMCLQKLPRLRVLDVSACIHIGDYGVLHISEISSIEKLNISALNVTEYGFMLCAVLPNLRVFDVQGCYPIRDASMAHVHRFPRLEMLNISNNRITDEGLADIAKCETLRRLVCKHTCISEDGLRQLLDEAVTVEHDNYTRGSWYD